MNRYHGINHLAFATGDLDRTIRFWRDLLEMPLVVGLGQPGFRQYFFALDERTLISFFQWPDVEPMPEKDHGSPVKGPFGFDHVSIGVTSMDVLWDLKDRLDAAGFWVSEAVDHGFIVSIYSFDPNEIPIEFSWARPDVDVRARPQMIDKERSAIADEGAGPRPEVWPAVSHPTTEEEKRIYPGDGQELRDLARRDDTASCDES